MKSLPTQPSILAVVSLALFLGACAPGSSPTGVDLDISSAAEETATALARKSDPLTTAGTYNLSVRVTSSTAALRVSNSSFGINCSRSAGICSVRAAMGTSILLTATEKNKNTAVTWSGACAGVSTSCLVTMNGDQLVLASH
jgi:hypothetical protein